MQKPHKFLDTEQYTVFWMIWVIKKKFWEEIPEFLESSGNEITVYQSLWDTADAIWKGNFAGELPWKTWNSLG